jgi:hypothetical protein
MIEPASRKVRLRNEDTGRDRRFLDAFLDAEGDLHIDGQDLGPATAPVSPDGEYEWFSTVRSEHVSQLVELLGGDAGADILDLLEKHYTGAGSYELERILRDDDVPVERFVY